MQRSYTFFQMGGDQCSSRRNTDNPIVVVVGGENDIKDSNDDNRSKYKDHRMAQPYDFDMAEVSDTKKKLLERERMQFNIPLRSWPSGNELVDSIASALKARTMDDIHLIVLERLEAEKHMKGWLTGGGPNIISKALARQSRCLATAFRNAIGGGSPPRIGLGTHYKKGVSNPKGLAWFLGTPNFVPSLRMFHGSTQDGFPH